MDAFIQFAAIFGTIGLLWLTLTGLKRIRGNAKPSAQITVQQRIPITGNCQLVVVHWDGQELLLSTGTQPCMLVSSKPIQPTRQDQEAQSAWAL